MIRLLLPVDGSETSARAVRAVIDWYRRLAPLEVRLLHVRIADSASRAGRDDPSSDDAFETGKRALEWAQDMLRGAGIACIAEHGEGYVPSAIVDHARSASCDAIVIGTRGMGSTGEVLGSIARQVIALADVPVVLVK